MEELIEMAAKDLINSKYAIALTGAGISTESGIPDFRGPNGIWTKHPEAEKEAYEHYDELLRNPKSHWEKILTPGSIFDLFDKMGKFSPNPGHYALANLEKMGILKLIITQNADGLHQKAGSQNVIEYHGSLSKLRCMSCGARFDREEYDLEKLKKEGKLPPRCKKCNGVLKYDGVYFREPIPEDVRKKSEEEALKCDLMLICGTSAVVYPFADLPKLAKFSGGRTFFGIYLPTGVRRNVGIIEVNADPTPLTGRISDYLIQGKTGEILPKIVEEVKKIRR